MSPPNARSIRSMCFQLISFSVINTPLTMPHKVSSVFENDTNEGTRGSQWNNETWDNVQTVYLLPFCMKILIMPHSLQHAVVIRDGTFCVRGFSIFCWTSCRFWLQTSSGRPSILCVVISTHHSDRMTSTLIPAHLPRVSESSCSFFF